MSDTVFGTVSDTVLEIEGLTKRFGGVTALDRVSFEVGRGTIVSLIGPNGAGKTTLFNCLTGVLSPDEGSMALVPPGTGRDQVPISLQGRPPHEVARLGIARTFQNVRLFANMTVLENVLIGTHVRTKAGWLDALWPWGSRQRDEENRWAMEKTDRLLRRLGLTESASSLAGSLSYGEQRRLELARALASDPQLVLLDEPAAGLTFQEKETLMEFLQELQGAGLTILLIEHDMRVVMPISTQVVVLDYGAKIAEGPPQMIREDRRVIEAYLGVEVTE